MKRKEVKVLGLSYAQSQVGSYVLILSEKKGKMKLPIVIKPADAQRVALELEGIKSPRPDSYDIIRSINDSYGIDVQEVFIHTLAEGIFYTKMVVNNGIEDVDIECSVGDGVVLSSIYKCPIYVSNTVMNAAGVMINDDGTPIDDEFVDDDSDFEPVEDNTRVVSVENLKKMLEEAVKNEEYEVAAEIRDRISKLNQ